MQLMIFADECHTEKYRIGLTDSPQEGPGEYLGVEFPELAQMLRDGESLGGGWFLDDDIMAATFTCDHGDTWRVADNYPTVDAGLSGGQIWAEFAFDVERVAKVGEAA